MKGETQVRVVRADPSKPPTYANYATAHHINDGFVQSFGYIDGMDIREQQDAAPSVRLHTQIGMPADAFFFWVNELLGLLARLPPEFRNRVDRERVQALLEELPKVNEEAAP